MATINVLDPDSDRHILHVLPDRSWDPLPFLASLGVKEAVTKDGHGVTHHLFLKSPYGERLSVDRQAALAVELDVGTNLLTIVRSTASKARDALCYGYLSEHTGAVLVHRSQTDLEAALTAEWGALRERHTTVLPEDEMVDREMIDRKMIEATLTTYFIATPEAILRKADEKANSLRFKLPIKMRRIEHVVEHLCHTVPLLELIELLEPDYRLGQLQKSSGLLERPRLSEKIASGPARHRSTLYDGALGGLCYETHTLIAYQIAAWILRNCPDGRKPHVEDPAKISVVETPEPEASEADDAEKRARTLVGCLHEQLGHEKAATAIKVLGAIFPDEALFTRADAHRKRDAKEA